MTRITSIVSKFIKKPSLRFLVSLFICISILDSYSQITFTPNLLSDSVYNVTTILATDIDQDNDFDIFVQSYKETPTSGANHKQFNLFWLQQNEESFSQGGVIFNIYGGSFNGIDFNIEDLQFVDLNNDQSIDILTSMFIKITGEERFGFQWHENKSDGSFDGNIIDKNNHGNSYGIPTIANLESDTTIDILIVQSDYLLRYKSTGSRYDQFELADTLIEQSFEKIFAEDINGDSKDDLISYKNDSLQWFANNGFGQFTSQPTAISIGLNIDALLFEDLDFDGFIDIITIKENNVSYFKNRGDGSFENEQILVSLPNGISVKQLNFGDIDLDSNIDLILNTSEGIKFFKNNGLDGFNQEIIVSNKQSHFIQTIDFDQDGYLDVLSADTDNTIQMYRNNLGDQPLKTNNLVQFDLKATFFPNPMTDQTTLSFYKPLPFKVDLFIYDSAGKVIQQILKIQEQNIQIKNQNLSKGIYLINLLKNDSNKSLGSYKLIVN